MSYPRALGLPLLEADFHPPSIDAQETLLEELRILEDVQARRLAQPLPRRDWWDVITDESEHPTATLICDNCGEVTQALLYCGVILCVPCWRKKARRDGKELLLTLQAYIKTRPSSIPLYLRFVTLTIRSGPDLEERVRVLLDAWARLRHRTWWARKTLGAALKVEVTWNPAQGWHPHLHILQVGSFLDQDVLSERWAEATRGEGFIVDVGVRGGPSRGLPISRGGEGLRGLIKELAKYVAKPTAPVDGGKSLPLQDWPKPIRSELAALLAGGPRTRWWCPTHLSASWERCQGEVLPGMVKIPCGPEARYRVELTGFRRLRWYGVLREAHREADALEFAKELERRCGSCGKGTLRSLRTFEAWARFDPSWLQFIRGHKSTDGPSPPTPEPRSRWVPDPLQETLHLKFPDRPPPGGGE